MRNKKDTERKEYQDIFFSKGVKLWVHKGCLIKT